MAMPPEISSLLKKIIEFRDARDWEKFHTLKNLSSALAVEAAELMEITQWKSDKEIELDLAKQGFRSKISDEIADVFIYLLLICDKAGVDPIVAAHRKILRNEERYPAEKVRGSAVKYSDLR